MSHLEFGEHASSSVGQTGPGDGLRKVLDLGLSMPWIPADLRLGTLRQLRASIYDALVGSESESLGVYESGSHKMSRVEKRAEFGVTESLGVEESGRHRISERRSVTKSSRVGHDPPY